MHTVVVIWFAVMRQASMLHQAYGRRVVMMYHNFSLPDLSYHARTPVTQNFTDKKRFRSCIRRSVANRCDADPYRKKKKKKQQRKRQIAKGSRGLLARVAPRQPQKAQGGSSREWPRGPYQNKVPKNSFPLTLWPWSLRENDIEAQAAHCGTENIVLLFFVCY